MVSCAPLAVSFGSTLVFSPPLWLHDDYFVCPVCRLRCRYASLSLFERCRRWCALRLVLSLWLVVALFAASGVRLQTAFWVANFCSNCGASVLRALQVDALNSSAVCRADATLVAASAGIGFGVQFALRFSVRVAARCVKIFARCTRRGAGTRTAPANVGAGRCRSMTRRCGSDRRRERSQFVCGFRVQVHNVLNSSGEAFSVSRATERTPFRSTFCLFLGCSVDFRFRSFVRWFFFCDFPSLASELDFFEPFVEQRWSVDRWSIA